MSLNIRWDNCISLHPANQMPIHFFAQHAVRFVDACVRSLARMCSRRSYVCWVKRSSNTLFYASALFWYFSLLVDTSTTISTMRKRFGKRMEFIVRLRKEAMWIFELDFDWFIYCATVSFVLDIWVKRDLALAPESTRSTNDGEIEWVSRRRISNQDSRLDNFTKAFGLPLDPQSELAEFGSMLVSMEFVWMVENGEQIYFSSWTFIFID